MTDDSSIDHAKAMAAPSEVGHRRRPVHRVVGVFIALLFVAVQVLLFVSYRQAKATGEHLGSATDTTTTLANMHRESLLLQGIVLKGEFPEDLQELALRRGLVGRQLNIFLSKVDAEEQRVDLVAFRAELLRFDEELARLEATRDPSSAEVEAALMQTLENLGLYSKRLFDVEEMRLYGAIYEDLQQAERGQLLLGGLSTVVLILGTGLAFVLRRSVRRDFTAAHDALIGEMHEREILQKRLTHQAYHDSLTGLANRAMFLHELERSLARGDRAGTSTSLVYLDLDDFKAVNDTLGHAAGDELLRGVASRLESCVRRTDMVARLGGDEFAIVLENSREAGDVMVVMERIVDEMAKPFLVAGQMHTTTASLGVVPDLDSQTPIDDLIRNADMAMYEAKMGGKGAYVVFQESMRIQASRRNTLERDLALAVERKEFVCYYQPIVNLKEQRLEGVEALVRWRQASGEVRAPGDFLPMAEETGLIKQIGEQVLSEAAASMADWQRRLPEARDLFVSVNISGQELDDPFFSERVASVLQETRLRPESLVIEITESTMMRDPDSAARALGRLRALGVRVAIDDFGTGYSSLSYLRFLPVDILKIDRSFISSLPEEHAIAETIANLANTLGMVSLAEGIEERDQWDRLEVMGCALGQGFLIAKPQPAEEIWSRIESATRKGSLEAFTQEDERANVG